MQDDPVCVAARKDGTKVVTGLWVDDSLDLGAMADADHVGSRFQFSVLFPARLASHALSTLYKYFSAD